MESEHTRERILQTAVQFASAFQFASHFTYELEVLIHRALLVGRPILGSDDVCVCVCLYVCDGCLSVCVWLCSNLMYVSLPLLRLCVWCSVSGSDMVCVSVSVSVSVSSALLFPPSLTLSPVSPTTIHLFISLLSHLFTRSLARSLTLLFPPHSLTVTQIDEKLQRERQLWMVLEFAKRCLSEGHTHVQGRSPSQDGEQGQRQDHEQDPDQAKVHPQTGEVGRPTEGLHVELIASIAASARKVDPSSWSRLFPAVAGSPAALFAQCFVRSDPRALALCVVIPARVLGLDEVVDVEVCVAFAGWCRSLYVPARCWLLLALGGVVSECSIVGCECVLLVVVSET
jgi:hypothetical protein